MSEFNKCIYEIMYKDPQGDIYLCSDHIEHELEAIAEVETLQNEFHENHYYYEVVLIE